ncbi:hypothetical protein KKH18_06905 [bacterium]|nr:hypothetical protein [bacterium]
MTTNDLKRIDQLIREHIATGGVLTTANLLDTVAELRRLVLTNAHRLPKAKYLADHLGACESCIIEQNIKEEDKLQEQLPLDAPEAFDAEFEGEGTHASRKAS